MKFISFAVPLLFKSLLGLLLLGANSSLADPPSPASKPAPTTAPTTAKTAPKAKSKTAPKNPTGGSIKTPLRYQLTPGDAYRYTINITIGADPQLPADQSEQRTGTVIFQVLRFGTNGFTLVSQGVTDAVTTNANAQYRDLTWLGPWPSSKVTTLRHLIFDGVGRNKSDSASSLYTPTVGNIATTIFMPHPDAKALFRTRSEAILNRRANTGNKAPQKQTSQKQVAFNAIESTVFDLIEYDGKRAIVTFKVQLISIRLIEGQPHLAVTGSGKIEYDMTRGLPLSGQFSGKIQLRGEKPKTFYIKRSFKLQEVEQGTVVGKAMSAQTTRRVAALNIPNEKRKALSGAELSRVLIILGSANIADRELAVETLAKAKPVTLQKAHVIFALKAVQKDLESHFVRLGATQAIELWAKAPNAPAAQNIDPLMRLNIAKLIKRLKIAKSLKDKRKIIDQLAAYKNKLAADALTDALDTSSRHYAVRGLKAMGPTAADSVIKALSHRSPFVVMSACEILGAVGSQKHISALAGLSTRSKSRVIKQEAGRAMAAIKSRLKK